MVMAETADASSGETGLAEPLLAQGYNRRPLDSGDSLARA